MSLYSQNRLSFLNEDDNTTNKPTQPVKPATDKEIADNKAAVEDFNDRNNTEASKPDTTQQQTQTSGTEEEKPAATNTEKINTDTLNTEAYDLDVTYDPEFVTEMVDEYIEENYKDDLGLSFYIAEMQAKMFDTLDIIAENFNIVNEADDVEHVSGDVVDADGNEVEQDTKPQNTGLANIRRTDNSKDVEGEGNSQVKKDDEKDKKDGKPSINLKELVKKIIAKLKEIIEKIKEKVDEFIDHYTEDLKAFFGFDQILLAKYYDNIMRARENDLDNLPTLKVNKELLEDMVKDQELKLTTNFDFTKYGQLVKDNQITADMDADEVGNTKKKFNEELDAINGEVDEKLKGFKEKPVPIKFNLNAAKSFAIILRDNVKNTDMNKSAADKQMTAMYSSVKTQLDSAVKEAEIVLKQVENEHSENAEITIAAKALYELTSTACMSCAKTMAKIIKFNIKKLNLVRKGFTHVGKFLSYEISRDNEKYKEYEQKDEDNGGEEGQAATESAELVTESPILAGMSVIGAYYLTIIAGTLVMINANQKAALIKACKYYEDKHKDDKNFVKFSDLDKESMKRFDSKDEKHEIKSSTIDKLFGKDTANDTIDIYKNKDGKELFSVSYAKKQTRDTRDQITIAILDESVKEYLTYYAVNITFKKFGYTSMKVNSWVEKQLKDQHLESMTKFGNNVKKTVDKIKGKKVTESDEIVDDFDYEALDETFEAFNMGLAVYITEMESKMQDDLTALFEDALGDNSSEDTSNKEADDNTETLHGNVEDDKGNTLDKSSKFSDKVKELFEKAIQIIKELIQKVKEFIAKLKAKAIAMFDKHMANKYADRIRQTTDWSKFKPVKCKETLLNELLATNIGQIHFFSETKISSFDFEQYSKDISGMFAGFGQELRFMFIRDEEGVKNILKEFKEKIEGYDKEVDELANKLENDKETDFVPTNKQANGLAVMYETIAGKGEDIFEKEFKNVQFSIVDKLEKTIDELSKHSNNIKYKVMAHEGVFAMQHMVQAFGKIEKYQFRKLGLLRKLFFKMAMYSKKKANKKSHVSWMGDMSLDQMIADKDMDELKDFVTYHCYSATSEYEYKKNVESIDKILKADLDFDDEDGSIDKIKIEQYSNSQHKYVECSAVRSNFSKEKLEKIKTLLKEVYEFNTTHDDEGKEKEATNESVDMNASFA